MRATGLDRETLRFYEKKGLLPNARRTDVGYRQYDSTVVSRIKFIKLAQDVGFSLREILELLSLGEKKAVSKTELKSIATMKIADLDARIQSLQRMRKLLEDFSRTAVRPTKGSSCPILAQFKKLEF